MKSKEFILYTLILVSITLTIGLVLSLFILFDISKDRTQQKIEPIVSMYGDKVHKLGVVPIGNTKDQYIKAMYVQFKDTAAYVKFSVPTRFENRFIANLITISLNYNVADTESHGDELGKDVVTWITEVFTGIDFRVNETIHISPPLRNY